jgi:hypothetical protein
MLGGLRYEQRTRKDDPPKPEANNDGQANFGNSGILGAAIADPT